MMWPTGSPRPFAYGAECRPRQPIGTNRSDVQDPEGGSDQSSLDVADNDLTSFVRHLVAALRAVRPGVGDATEGLFGPGVSPSVDLIGAMTRNPAAARARSGP